MQKSHEVMAFETDGVQRYQVPGIQNLGNTCFFNAILQALAAVACFREYLEQIIEQSLLHHRTFRGKAKVDEIPLTQALALCLQALAPVDENAPCTVVIPRRLNLELCNKLKNFRGNKQQDAQELLQFLMSLVDHEQQVCTRTDRGLIDLLPTNASFASTGSISDLCFEDAMQSERWNPLYGLQVNLQECLACHRFRPMANRRFLDVSLSLGDVFEKKFKQTIGLVDCLQKYTAPEHIAQVECTSCTVQHEIQYLRKVQETFHHDSILLDSDWNAYEIKKHLFTLNKIVNDQVEIYSVGMGSDTPHRIMGPCQKRLQFSRCPDIFCFHFNRKVYHMESDSTRKVETHVQFPLTLDMSPYCHLDQNSTLQSYVPSMTNHYLLYELKAVILHHGTDRSGHYTTYRRVVNQWFFISDETVKEVTEAQVLASCAYMLFYERIEREHTKGIDEDVLANIPDDISLIHDVTMYNVSIT